jgi:hypothetical protein
MKTFLIAFILFLLLVLFFTHLPKTGEFAQTGEESTSNSGWKTIGRVSVENGRILEVNFTFH